MAYLGVVKVSPVAHLCKTNRHSRTITSSFPRRRKSTGRRGHATLSTCWIRPWRKLVLASRQYPQGGDGRTSHTHHCGLDPPVHRDENDEEQSSSALQAHTLAQRDRRLVNPGGAGDAGEQDNTPPSPLMETFAKFSGTAIICSDSQSAKLDFPIDSRLRGNDGRFCKDLLDGRGIKACPSA